MAAHQAPPSLGFSRQEPWSGLPLPSPMHESEKWKRSRSVVSDSQRPQGLQPTRLICPWDFPGKSIGVGCHCFLQKNKLAASKYLAPWGNSSKPTDEASLQDPLSSSQHLTPIPLAERSLNVTYKCRPKGRIRKAWCGLSHKGNRGELWPHP